MYAPDDDPEMEIVNYDRTFEQNEELGLNDMKTENYESSWQKTENMKGNNGFVMSWNAKKIVEIKWI